jgi:hypothetical protein
VHFDGSVAKNGKGWTIEEIDAQQPLPALPSSLQQE